MLAADVIAALQPEMEWWPKHELGGQPVPDGFSYTSDTNSRWLSADELRAMLEGSEV